ACPAKEHCVFTYDLTSTDDLNTDLGIRTLTNHPMSPIDCHVIQLLVPRLCDKRRQAQGCPARRIDLRTVVGFQDFNIVVRPEHRHQLPYYLEHHIHTPTHVRSHKTPHMLAQTAYCLPL